MILPNLIIYNKLTLFYKNNNILDKTGLEISLVLDRIIYSSCRLYQIVFKSLFLL